MFGNSFLYFGYYMISWYHGRWLIKVCLCRYFWLLLMYIFTYVFFTTNTPVCFYILPKDHSITKQTIAEHNDLCSIKYVVLSYLSLSIRIRNVDWFKRYRACQVCYCTYLKSTIRWFLWKLSGSCTCFKLVNVA